jgi:hypothetical protein
MKASLVCPPTRTKFCCWLGSVEELENVGCKAVMEKPASAIGGPRLVETPSSYGTLPGVAARDDGTGSSVSIILEYVAKDAQSSAEPFDVGHIPPKT